jgi:hypothetical protein
LREQFGHLGQRPGQTSPDRQAVDALGQAGKPAAGSEALDFSWRVHGYTNEYIRFADQKAGVVLAVESGLVAALYSAKLHQARSLSRLNVPNAVAFDTLLGVTSFLAFAALLLGVLFALLAITPRLWHEFVPSIRARVLGKLTGETPKGAIFWKQVLAHKQQEEYATYLAGMTAGQKDLAVAHHVFALAGVADAKFGWINLSIGAGAIGATFAIVALFAGG